MYAPPFNTQVLTKVVCLPTCIEYTTYYYLNMLYHFLTKLDINIFIIKLFFWINNYNQFSVLLNSYSCISLNQIYCNTIHVPHNTNYYDVIFILFFLLCVQYIFFPFSVNSTMYIHKTWNCIKFHRDKSLCAWWPANSWLGLCCFYIGCFS